MDIVSTPIKPEKQKSWHFYMHPYFTKQASNVVSEYIQHYTKEGDTVLDCYSGTGVTAIEALALKRKAIALDINPLACFITEQTVKQIDTQLLSEAFLEIEKNLKAEIVKIDNTPLHEFDNQAIPYWHPHGIRMPNNADFEFVDQLWTKKQLIALSMLWHEINQIKTEDIREQLKLVFSATISRVNVTYNLSKSRQKGDKIKLGDGGSSIFAQYRYWRPPEIVELPVWARFADRFKRIKKGKEKWSEITKDFNVADNFTLIQGSALELSNYIDRNSIDYIYTDPPYGANIAYLDLSTMWNAWLGFSVTPEMRQQEVIEGGDLIKKSSQDYAELFTQSFVEMGKVLKKDGWLSCVFAYKKLEYWNVIIDGCENNGMEFKGSVYQPTNNSSVHYKKNPAGVLCSQRIANFQKTFNKADRPKFDNLQQFILNEMERACIKKRGASIDTIYNKVLDKLLLIDSSYEAKKKGYTQINNLYKLLDDKEP